MQNTVIFYVESCKEGSAKSQKSYRDFFVYVVYKEFKTFWRSDSNIYMQQ